MTDRTPHFTDDGRAGGGALDAYLRAIRARRWLVVLIVLAAAGLAAVLTVARSPRYQASAQILVSPLSQDSTTLLGLQLLRDSGDPTRTLQTAATLVASPQAAALTAQRVGAGYTTASVTSAVKVDPLGASDVLGVTATAGDAQLAARLANAYATAALDLRNAAIRGQVDAAVATLAGDTSAGAATQRQQLEAIRAQGDPTLSIAHPASVPTGRSGPSTALVIVLALLAGLVLASVTALVMERVDRRVRETDELLGLGPFPLLTRVPRLAHGGHPLELPAPVREAFRVLQIQLDQRHEGGCRTVMVTSGSSGDGKTTTVLCLAFALVAAGHRVLALDLDLRRPDLARQLQLAPGRGISALLSSDVRVADVAQHAPRLAPLRVVPATGDVSDIALLPVLAQRMGTILDQAADLADYVLIDTPPLGEVGDALAIAAHADDLLIVGRPGNTERRSAEVMVGLLDRSAIRPAGWVILGEDAGGRSSSHYATESPRRTSGTRRRNG